MALTQPPHDMQQEWWRGAVIGQIYPCSFLDTDDDDIGDLTDVIDRSDYIALLNMDAIWLSPFFTSPVRDFGYDVSDHRDVYPMFGTREDFDGLMEAAHARDHKVTINQLLSHSSDQHPWFQESRQRRDNPKADWSSPWLPIPAEHRKLAVDQQEHAPDSLFNAYPDFLAFYRRQPARFKSDIRYNPLQNDVLRFERRHDEERLLITLNFANTPHKFPAHAEDKAPTNAPALVDDHWANGRLQLPANGITIAGLGDDADNGSR